MKDAKSGVRIGFHKHDLRMLVETEKKAGVMVRPDQEGVAPSVTSPTTPYSDMRVGSTAGDMASEEEPSHRCERTSPCLSPEDGAVHAAGGIRRHARANRPARPRVDDACLLYTSPSPRD